MNSVVEDIRTLIEADPSLNLVFADTLFLYKEPAKPDNCATLFDTPGMPPIGLLSSNEDTKHYERPSFQIRVRHKEADVGYSWALQIMNALHAKSHQTVGLYHYSLIAAISNPFMLDWDDVNRVRIVINFNVQRRLI